MLLTLYINKCGWVTPVGSVTRVEVSAFNRTNMMVGLVVKVFNAGLFLGTFRFERGLAAFY